ncbi:hypothetical protein [Streptomyces zhihengii]
MIQSIFCSAEVTGFYQVSTLSTVRYAEAVGGAHEEAPCRGAGGCADTLHRVADERRSRIDISETRAGELDFSEIVETTGPRNTDGSLKHGTSQDEGNAA